MALHKRAYHRLADIGSALAKRPSKAGVDPKFELRLLWASGIALTRIGMGPDAVKVFAQAMRMSSFGALTSVERNEFQCDEAAALRKTGDTAGAAALLQSVLVHSPMHGRAVVDLAAIIAASAPDQAVDLLNSVDGDRKIRTRAAILRAEILSEVGKESEAMAALSDMNTDAGPPRAMRAALLNASRGTAAHSEWQKELLSWLPASDSIRIELAEDAKANILDRLVVSEPAGAGGEPGPLVVVVMTVFNAADTLGFAVRSVLKQTHRNLRLVTVNDRSTDNSLELLRALAAEDNRIAIIENYENVGTYVSKNRALKLVAGDFYTFHDSDDWMHPERLARHVAEMMGNPKLKASYSRWLRLTADGRVVEAASENPASSFFRAAVLDDVGYFDSVRASADGEFRWRLRRRFGLAAVPVLPEVLTLGLSRPGSLTTGGAAQFDRFGYNPLRAQYNRAWMQWQRDAELHGTLHMPFPQHERLFPAPEQLLAPPPEAPIEIRPPAAPDATPLVVAWPIGPNVLFNWGDKLSAELVRMLAGRPATNHSAVPKNAPKLFVIGSSLASARDVDSVWGSGFISGDTGRYDRSPMIYAVRGPLTRNALLGLGKQCPEIYGDPALLLPLFYNPEVDVTYDVGVIQHAREAGIERLPQFPAGQSVRLIDINGGIEEVVDAILSCRRILSSSLHGIIAAHTYGVPAVWWKASDRPLGDGFKFKDYWASMGQDDVEPETIAPGMLFEPSRGVSTPGKPLVDLFALIQACPFIDDDRKAALVSRARDLAAEMRPNAIFRIHAGLDRGDGGTPTPRA